MPPRQRPSDVAADRARAELTRLVGELRRARVDRGLRQVDVARSAGLSGSRLSRIERGLVGSLSISQLSLLMAAVGLDLSLRAFPAGQPIRDAAHASLLARLRGS
jgi:transcriptional regulator with XRE-family HTH domain